MTFIELAHLQSENTRLRSELESYRRIARSTLRTHRQSPSNPPSSSPSFVWLYPSDLDRFRELLDEPDDLQNESISERWCRYPFPPLPPPSSDIVPFRKSFPTELFLEIGQHLPSQALSQLCQTSLGLASAFLPLLYDHATLEWLSSERVYTRLFCRECERIPSRVNNLLSLCHTTTLTLSASYLEHGPFGRTHPHRSASDPLLLDSLIILMDDNHLVFSEMTPREECDQFCREEHFCSQEKHHCDDCPTDEGRHELIHTGIITAKALFYPQPAPFDILNPRRLVIEATNEFLKRGHEFASFNVFPVTADIISSWSRLRLVQLKSALLVLAEDESDEEENDPLENLPTPLVPTLANRSATGSIPISIQIHLPSARHSHHLPVFTGAYGNNQSVHLSSYLKSALDGHPASLCYPDEATLSVLTAEMDQEGGDWRAQFEICSMEEAETEARRILAGESVENGGGKVDAGDS